MGIWKSFIGNANTRLTPEGGLAIRMINKTGANSIKGSVLEVSLTTDNGVKLIDIDDIDPIGIIYDNNIPDGELVWVVVSGLAEVLYSTPVALGTISRCPAGGDASGTIGEAINEPLPAPPFATDKHFQEIGHPIEAIGSPGLALTDLHFN